MKGICFKTRPSHLTFSFHFPFFPFLLLFFSVILFFPHIEVHYPWSVIWTLVHVPLHTGVIKLTYSAKKRSINRLPWQLPSNRFKTNLTIITTASTKLIFVQLTKYCWTKSYQNFWTIIISFWFHTLCWSNTKIPIYWNYLNLSLQVNSNIHIPNIWL